jgi:hypothetical protein
MYNYCKNKLMNQANVVKEQKENNNSKIEAENK